MISFKQYLMELFDSAAPWQYVDSTEKKIKAAFTIEENKYEAMFFKYRDDEFITRHVFHIPKDEHPEIWEFQFALTAATGEPLLTILGGKPSLEVFATCAAILKDFRASHPDAFISFSAKEASKIVLYRKMAARFPYHKEDKDGLTHFFLVK
jgi:hypothetical protein